MPNILISYDLLKPGQNYNELYDAIKNISGFWSHPVESVWIVDTYKSASDVRDLLKSHIDSNDKLFVTELAAASWASWGLNPKVANWLKQH